jgi:hypothetical protein
VSLAVNSEPRTGARPPVRLCVGVIRGRRRRRSTSKAKPEATRKLCTSTESPCRAATAPSSASSLHRPGHRDQERSNMLIRERRRRRPRRGFMPHKAYVCAAKLRPSLKLLEGTSPRRVSCLCAEDFSSAPAQFFCFVIAMSVIYRLNQKRLVGCFVRSLKTSDPQLWPSR